MWARKTFVHTSLKDLQLPAEQVMMVTGHRSEIQMRNDYHAGTLEPYKKSQLMKQTQPELNKCEQ